MARARARQTADIALLFGWNFAVVTAIFVGRTVRDVLFLAHESPARLPYLYIASPILVTLVGLAYGRIADRFRRERLVVATALGFAAVMIAAQLALGPRWLYYALYVAVECMSAIAIMQFWITAGERFAPRDAKRWFGVIAAGGTAANIVIGLTLTALVRHTGAAALLWIVAGALVAVAVLASALARRPVLHHAGARPRAGGGGGIETSPPGTSHLRLLAPMIALGVVAVTLLDFQFKAITTAHYDGDRVEMVGFFAALSAGTGAASLLIQLTLTGRLLARFGIAGALLLLPTTLSLGAAALLIAPTLASATISKAADATLRYTVHDAGMQLVYLPVPRAVRGRRKAFLDGVVRPGAEATVGAALLAYRTVAGALAPLAVVALAAAALWVGLVVKMRGAYARALAETLRRRRVVADGVDEARATREATAAIRAALAAADRDDLLRGLDLARLAPAAAAPDVAPLVHHADPELRAAALAVLGGAAAAPELSTSRRASLDPAVAAALAAGLADADPRVRAAAARAAGPAQLAGLRPLLDDGEVEVASAAAVTLHAHGDAADRARALDRVAALVRGDAPRARRAGVEAAEAIADAALAPSLIARLDDRHDRRRAARALGAIGGAAEPAVIAALRDPPRTTGALAALGAMATPRAVATIVDRVAATDAAEAERDAACAALVAAVRAGAALDRPDGARVIAAARAELTFAFTAMAAAEGLGRDESTLAPDGTRTAVPFAPGTVEGPAALISKALRERMERATARVLDLLAALDPALDLATARTNLREPDPTRRANAVELLDAQRWAPSIAPLKALVLALLDESTRDRKLAIAERALALPQHTRDGWVAVLLADPSAWIATCTAYYAGAAAVVAARPALEALAASDRAPVAAETAGAALARIADPPDHAREATMLTTADKVLFLKGLELFTQVPSEDLADLAALCEELALDDGERLFAEHDPGDALYLIVEGTIGVVRGGAALAELGVREVLGEMAVLDPAPRSADAVARGPVRLLRLTRDDFANLLGERPEVAAGVIRVLTRRLRRANRTDADRA